VTGRSWFLPAARLLYMVRGFLGFQMKTERFRKGRRNDQKATEPHCTRFVGEKKFHGCGVLVLARSVTTSAEISHNGERRGSPGRPQKKEARKKDGDNGQRCEQGRELLPFVHNEITTTKLQKKKSGKNYPNYDVKKGVNEFSRAQSACKGEREL